MISQPGHMYILGQKKFGNSLRSLLEDFATLFVALHKCFNISYFFWSIIFNNLLYSTLY